MAWQDHGRSTATKLRLATLATLALASSSWLAGVSTAEPAAQVQQSVPPGSTSTPRVLPDGLEELLALRPAWPNPYLSFLPAEATSDDRYWRAVMRQQAQARRPATAQGPLMIDESEPNDTPETANFIADFGTGEGQTAAANVAGSFAAQPAPSAIGPFTEDEGSIPLASDTGVTVGSAVRISGTIGDGPFGSGGTGSGDFDFYRITGVEVGQLILIDVDTADPTADLDSFIGLYDGEGNSLALNEDDDIAGSLDSFLAIPASVPGDYYVSIAGSIFPFAAVLLDPYDSSSGFGVGSEGDYEMTIALDDGDADWFSFDLEPCDILGVNLLGAGSQVSLFGPSGELQLSSAQDLTGIFPAASPLPGGGTAVASFVAAERGRYRLRALGNGGPNYSLELRVFRHPAESSPVAKKIFVDFDGATVDPAIFMGDPGTAVLSPLSSFLSRWGLGPADEDAIIDGTLASLRESLLSDPDHSGPNLGFDIELLNSRDHADPFGAADVSRLIIGGGIAELGIPTIGIAQSIDPGNLETAETAVVLLDLLSGDAADPNSLNSFALAPGVTRIELIGLALGNIAAHEAGHYVGNFHTEQTNPLANIMDRGGNLPNTLGLGPDEIFGNEDDVDVDFGADKYEGAERFAGTENTLAVVACGCTTSAGIFGDGFETGDVSRWANSATGR